MRRIDRAHDRVELNHTRKIKAKPLTDNKRKRGEADRRKAARLQDYEVAYIAKKFGVAPSVVRRVIKRVGNVRHEVYAELRKLKKSAACRRRVDPNLIFPGKDPDFVFPEEG